jgi:hypothetical protein
MASGWKPVLVFGFPINLSMALQSFVGPWPSFSFLILYTASRTPWMGDQPVARPLPIHKEYYKRTKTFIRVGFEPTIPVFQRAKAVHIVDRATTVIG